MGRWADMDSDEARLPEGMKRIGYDADSQKYTFFEAATGKYYESAPGNRYGVLRPIASPNNDHRFAPSGAPRRSNTYAGTRSSHRSSKRSTKRDSTFSDASTIVESVDSSMKDKGKDDFGSRRSSSSTERSLSPAPGRRFGQQPGARRARAQTFEGILNEGQPTVADDYGNREAYRTMLPFALLVLTVLLLVFKFTGFGTETVADDKTSQQVRCQEDFEAVRIQEGDTCWQVAQKYGVGVDEFLTWEGNRDLDCNHLSVGQSVCVPE